MACRPSLLTSADSLMPRCFIALAVRSVSVVTGTISPARNPLFCAASARSKDRAAIRVDLRPRDLILPRQVLGGVAHAVTLAAGSSSASQRKSLNSTWPMRKPPRLV